MTVTEQDKHKTTKDDLSQDKRSIVFVFVSVIAFVMSLSLPLGDETA
jgi:hypothetical protein